MAGWYGCFGWSERVVWLVGMSGVAGWFGLCCLLSWVVGLVGKVGLAGWAVWFGRGAGRRVNNVLRSYTLVSMVTKVMSLTILFSNMPNRYLIYICEC